MISATGATAALAARLPATSPIPVPAITARRERPLSHALPPCTQSSLGMLPHGGGAGNGG